MKIRDRSTLNLFDDSRIDSRIPLRVWVDPDDPNGDNFAGGGGAKLGIEQAYAELGLERRATDVAVNHWAEALAMYRANHPRCRVYCEDVRLVDPVKASGGRRYALAWFSPTCIFFSQARGGELDVDEATEVRGLADVAVTWARSKARPRVLCLENVKQFEQWGPLHRQHSNGCSQEISASRGTVTRKGKLRSKCLKGCCYGRPIKARLGEFFDKIVAELRQCYRYVEWRVLKAHHFGAPTSRERLFLIASDEPIVWPEPTHGPGKLPYRTAASCIDWSIPCPSIFERAKPYEAPTLRRIAHGLQKYVLASKPFIVPIAPRSARDHSGAVATLMAPFLVHLSNGERPGQAPRTYSTLDPLGTIMANGEKHGLVVAYLAKAYSERASGGWNGGQPVDAPTGAITAKDHHYLVSAFLVKYFGTSTAANANEPLHTIVGAGGGTHHALVTVVIDGESYVVVDIGMRRLNPRELFNCQGFPPAYRIDIDYNGKPLTKTAQIKCVGNSVPPPLAKAVAMAAIATIRYEERRAA